VVRGDKLGALHGLPVVIKDITPTAGIRTTYGSPLFADNVPTEDAEVVRQLKAAGAIVLGKTNTPEFAAGFIADVSLDTAVTNGSLRGVDLVGAFFAATTKMYDRLEFTHENVNGQELDCHVDFNFQIEGGFHRRANLLLYLNREWDPNWGGAIELHSDPRQPDTDQFTEFNVTFNRAVIFETNEYSWHGFRKIQLPQDRLHISRKCLSIYLYTRERPAHEIAGRFRRRKARCLSGPRLHAFDVAGLGGCIAHGL